MLKKTPILAAGFIILTILLLYSIGRAILSSDYALMFRSLTVTIHNETADDLMLIEMGVLSGTPPQYKTPYELVVKSGTKATVKPRLKLTGEGSVYMRYMDGAGKVQQQNVCGYTESLSGTSTVIIRKDGVKVEEKCY